jgi:peptide/nickel transport system permease protein
MRVAPYLMFLPAMAIVLSATSVNLIGDGLRDALDPHLKS